MTIGVYAVINKINRKAYIGSSANVERRLMAHKCAINTKHFIHYESYAEEAKNLSVDHFEFKILTKTETVQEARELETACLEAFFGDGLYNKAPHANGGTGTKRDRAKYVEGAKKRLSDPLFCKTLSEKCRGKREVVQCPHCGLAGGGGNMRRYHFDKCKAAN